MIRLPNRTSEESIEYENRIYLLGVMCFWIKALIDFSEILKRFQKFVDIPLLLLFIGLMVFKIIRQSYDKKTLIMSGAIVGICAITYLRVNYLYLICSVLCILAAQNVDFDRILKMSYRIKGTFIAIHVVLYAIARVVMPSAISYSYRGTGGLPRTQFFLSHANTFSMFLVWTIFEYLFVNYSIVTWKNILACWAIILFFYKFTDSNTMIIASTVVVVGMLCMKYWRGHKVISFISKYCCLICAIVFPVLIAIYTKLSGAALELWLQLDEIFTGRLLYGAVVYDLKGWTLLGKTHSFEAKTFWRGHWFDGIGCDNIYVWMFVCYGYLELLMVAFAFIRMNKYAADKEKIFIIAFVIYGIMEAYVTNALFCFPLLFIGKYFWENANKESASMCFIRALNNSRKGNKLNERESKVA